MASARTLDLALDATGDLDLVAGDLRMTTDPDEGTAQAIQVDVRTFKGELFVDEERGVPYTQRILGQRPANLAECRAYMLEAIAGAPGVAAVDSLAVTFDDSERHLSVEFAARRLTDDERTAALSIAAIDVEI